MWLQDLRGTLFGQFISIWIFVLDLFDELTLFSGLGHDALHELLELLLRLAGMKDYEPGPNIMELYFF